MLASVRSCSVESSPSVRGDPAEADLVAWVRAAAAAGVQAIRLTGGEPMLRIPVVLRLARECRRLGMASAITTNGFWGRTPRQADRYVRALKRAGLADRKELVFHSLRHSFATAYLAGGAAITDLQGILGHQSIETTQIYARMVDRRARASLEALEFGKS